MEKQNLLENPEELKSFLLTTINKIYKDKNEPNPVVAIIGNIRSCTAIANALGFDDEVVSPLASTDDIKFKLEYSFVDLSYEKYTIKLLCSNKMNHRNNVYILPCAK